MDLDRLHDQFGRKRYRGEGRTYDMLVEALHQAGSTDHVAVCATYVKDIPRLVGEFLEIARDVGYVHVLVTRDRIRVVTPDGTTYYHFTIDVAQRTQGIDVVFRDHYRELCR